MKLIVIIAVGLLILSLLSHRLVQVESKINEQNQRIEEQTKDLENLKLRNAELDRNLKEATSGAYLKSYLQRKKSPLGENSSDFIRTYFSTGVPANVLVAIAMAESGGCKRYISSTNNCFGLNSGRMGFDNMELAIEGTGKVIQGYKLPNSTDRKTYIHNLSVRYNPNHWQDYEKKLNYFLVQIDNHGPYPTTN